jgi:hypothetical protein
MLTNQSIIAAKVLSRGKNSENVNTAKSGKRVDREQTSVEGRLNTEDISPNIKDE